jgi:hypothetical protein
VRYETVEGQPSGKPSAPGKIRIEFDANGRLVVSGGPKPVAAPAPAPVPGYQVPPELKVTPPGFYGQ